MSNTCACDDTQGTSLKTILQQHDNINIIAIHFPLLSLLPFCLHFHHYRENKHIIIYDRHHHHRRPHRRHCHRSKTALRRLIPIKQDNGSDIILIFLPGLTEAVYQMGDWSWIPVRTSCGKLTRFICKIYICLAIELEKEIQKGDKAVIRIQPVFIQSNYEVTSYDKK